MEQWYIVCTYAVFLTLVICFSSQFHTNSKNKSHSQSHLHMWRGWNASMQLVNNLFYHLSHDCPHLNLCLSFKLFRNEQDLNFFINGNFYFNSSD